MISVGSFKRERKKNTNKHLRRRFDVDSKPRLKSHKEQNSTGPITAPISAAAQKSRGRALSTLRPSIFLGFSPDSLPILGTHPADRGILGSLAELSSCVGRSFSERFPCDSFNYVSRYLLEKVAILSRFFADSF